MIGAEVRKGLPNSNQNQGHPSLSLHQRTKKKSLYLSQPPQDFTEADFFAARNLNPGRANADRFDLTGFRNRRGKILMYHGLADGTIPPGSSELYYNKTQEAVGGDIRDFLRYFKVPGMQHCFWTPTQSYSPYRGSPYTVEADVKAPWMFAGAGQASFLGALTTAAGAGGAPAGVPGHPGSETHDALRALISWVEAGAAKAPDSIVATAWEYQLPLKIKRDRPICAYPKRTLLTSGGLENNAASWVCGTSPLQ